MPSGPQGEHWVWAVVLGLPCQLLMAVVRSYRLLLKPWLGNACRFEPTCSAYTLEALQQHGAMQGTALGTWRLLRCQPWCDGGYDPVPGSRDHPASGLFTRLGLIELPHPTIDDMTQPPTPVSSPPAPAQSRNLP